MFLGKIMDFLVQKLKKNFIEFVVTKSGFYIFLLIVVFKYLNWFHTEKKENIFIV